MIRGRSATSEKPREIPANIERILTEHDPAILSNCLILKTCLVYRRTGAVTLEESLAIAVAQMHEKIKVLEERELHRLQTPVQFRILPYLSLPR